MAQTSAINAIIADLVASLASISPKVRLFLAHGNRVLIS